MRESLRRLAAEDSMERRAGGERRARIELLNGEHINIDVDRKAKGGDLLDRICDELQVVEKDYFGLLHAQRGDPRTWVDLGRRLSKTFKNEPWDMRFAVKFYPPEPSELRDDETRNQLALAVRRDLMEGRLSCSLVTHALLASYVLQAELGDFEPAHVAPAALAAHSVAPLHVRTAELDKHIEELYRKHKGQNPAEAELCYLENAKKLPLYGAELHCVRDCDDVDLVLAVSAGGIAVYREGVLMNRFPWAKIGKISYNKRAYTLRLRAGEFDEFETHLGFKLASTRAGKKLWRCSVEHHMFFRSARSATTYTLRLRAGEFDEFEKHLGFKLASTRAGEKLWRCSVEHHMFFRRAAPVAVERIAGFPRFGSRRLSCRRTLRQMREPLPREIAA